jgi:hypothetical protein
LARSVLDQKLFVAAGNTKNCRQAPKLTHELNTLCQSVAGPESMALIAPHIRDPNVTDVPEPMPETEELEATPVPRVAADPRRHAELRLVR